MQRDEVLGKLRELKLRYEEDGVAICGIFGSLARGEEDINSDIDIAYKLDEKPFFPNIAALQVPVS
jgi:predicted nucleotidyltransferase